MATKCNFTTTRPFAGNFRQLNQLRRHDPTVVQSVERLLAAGFPDAAAHRIRQAMHQLLNRLINFRLQEQIAEEQTFVSNTEWDDDSIIVNGKLEIVPLYDLLIASRSMGASDTGDVYARVTWLKEAGQPKQTPKGVTLADLLPKLAGYTLADTQKTQTELIRKYRRAVA